MNENEVLTVTLTLENNEELECEVITIFEVQGQQYIALYPLFDEASDEDGSVYLYRFIDHGDEEPGLENIEADVEFEAVSDAFNAWADAQDFGDIDLDDMELIFPTIRPQSGKEGFLSRLLFSRN